MTDWRDRRSKALNGFGQKAVQNPDPTDRTYWYRKWRRAISNSNCVCDIDQVEYQIVRTGRKFHALLELTGTTVDNFFPEYFDPITDRMGRNPGGRDAQWNTAKHIADALGAKLYTVVFKSDLTKFWVYDGEHWNAKNPKQYKEWLRSMKPQEARIPPEPKAQGCEACLSRVPEDAANECPWCEKIICDECWPSHCAVCGKAKSQEE